MKKVLTIIALVSTLWACRLQPDVAELVEEMVVVTQYDKATLDTATYATYTLRLDTLGFVSNYYSDTIILKTVEYMNLGDLADQLPEVVQGEVENLNWARVDLDDDPDLIINVIVLDNLNVSITYNYPTYYSGYYGYYGYYGFYSYNAAQFGTLVIEILDAKNYAVNDNKYKVVWNASISDLYTSIDNVEKAIGATRQAFIQSPYLPSN